MDARNDLFCNNKECRGTGELPSKDIMQLPDDNLIWRGY